jgi:hypothetical protein
VEVQNPRALAYRLMRRVWDLPWRARELKDRVAPGEFARLLHRVRPYSGLSNARLRSLYRAVVRADRLGLPGDLVECGVASGGSAGMLALASQAGGGRRRLWLFDTFEGLPPPNANDPDFEKARHYTGSCVGTLEDVRGLMERLGVADRVEYGKGLFQQTLAQSPVRPIAVLHIDGDWYDSVTACLEALYDRVSPGGVVQIDDYGDWEGARNAVRDFFTRRGASPRLFYIDYTGRYFIKPGA